jgi:hypothetical protein
MKGLLLIQTLEIRRRDDVLEQDIVQIHSLRISRSFYVQAIIQHQLPVQICLNKTVAGAALTSIRISALSRKTTQTMSIDAGLEWVGAPVTLIAILTQLVAAHLVATGISTNFHCKEYRSFLLGQISDKLASNIHPLYSEPCHEFGRFKSDARYKEGYRRRIGRIWKNCSCNKVCQTRIRPF